MTDRRPDQIESGRVSPTAPETKSFSHVVWDHLESIPGFNDRLRAAERDLEDGKGVPFDDEDEATGPPQSAG